jgi:dTDP-4-dehydrorhamnose reductase
MTAAASRPTILITGGTGQIGHELVRELATLGRVASPGRSVLDMTNPDSIRDVMREHRPALVVNAAAYTAVDRAESEPELCTLVNTDAVRVLAEEAASLGGAIVHYSTDYVFDGRKPEPYVETDAANPLNVYGRSKLASERLLADSGIPYLVFRTSWVYGTRRENFALTMLRLAREREELRVVTDQRGAPTWSRTVALGTRRALAKLMETGASLSEAMHSVSGVYHLTARGSASWYEFAAAVLERDPARIDQRVKRIIPIATVEYPSAASRPANSCLDVTKIGTVFGVETAPWRHELNEVIAGLHRWTAAASAEVNER